MSKYNIDNGETDIVNKIKHHEKHNLAKNLMPCLQSRSCVH